MIKYILKRLLNFIPGLFILTFIGFYICSNVNENPVSMKLGENEDENPYKAQFLREKWHLDKPLFYFSLSSLSEPDTFYKIYNHFEREAAARILAETGNWEKIETYRKQIIHWKNIHKSGKNDSLLQNDSLYNVVYTYSAEQSQQLLRRFDKTEIKTIFDSLAQIYPQSEHTKSLLADFQLIEKSYNNIYTNPNNYQNYIPKISFYGFGNRYHIWLIGLMKGDWGVSYTTEMPVLTQIANYIPSSILLASISFCVIIIVGINLGLGMAAHKERKWSKYMLLILFALDAMPNFWIAIMLLFLFANPDILGIFPPHFEYSLQGLILPIVAYSFGGVIVVTQFVYQTSIKLWESDFVRTARAKGLQNNRIIYTHILKNAILPLIPLLSGFLPSLVSGSVLMEYIFSVGGMGEQILNAINENDMPMVLSIFVITGLLTMLGFLISDILLAKLDPRISQSFNENPPSHSK